MIATSAKLSCFGTGWADPFVLNDAPFRNGEQALHFRPLKDRDCAAAGHRHGDRGRQAPDG